MQDLMGLLNDQSKVISSLHKTIEGLNITVIGLNAEIQKLRTSNVDKEAYQDGGQDGGVINKDVSKNVSKIVSKSVITIKQQTWLPLVQWIPKFIQNQMQKITTLN